ncbi:dTDP-4-dehydrorhamnose reductase [Corallibacter vietnamensis]|uniref:dTDP-4-dehydrorhamnose reductase n=1 Tax=Corallibacter vietnamensis TaxID=904130 RepID=A0ABP7GY69_9FLAO
MTLNVLITGSNGQLATCIKDLERQHPNLSFIYTNSSQLDLTNQEAINLFFETNKIDWCINCAAYTAVDKAETDTEKAFKVNEQGPKHLALACNNHNVKLIHVSTDFVFDGSKSSPYNEEDQTKPLGVYGTSKLQGELAIKDVMNAFFIVRTSWLYSEHGNNFMKTMLRLAQTNKELNIVADQVGTPTYAKDLAGALLRIITSNSNKYGVYHYSNEGVTSWYDFAKAIFDISEIEIKVNPIPSKEFPTPAKRPSYSVLDKQKIKENLNIETLYWRERLKTAIKNLY